MSLALNSHSTQPNHNAKYVTLMIVLEMLLLLNDLYENYTDCYILFLWIQDTQQPVIWRLMMTAIKTLLGCRLYLMLTLCNSERHVLERGTYVSNFAYLLTHTTHARETAENRLDFSGAGFWYVCHANLGLDSSCTRNRRRLEHCSIPTERRLTCSIPSQKLACM